ncbi:helix-turn-helix transcriptional regulator [Micromonospora sp. WMMD882]|uniref:helix-turn-helix domain-containing protein n=1 Tax=Micromonospora sp. WMMD882 TaxID=3015151 RepID=UPI00248C60EA|nr:helix-turn-helix transcriptional regulator [Micromonospora sp. WMMD882]WBB80392.1 helix-turn-helix transcriptional regulator [Micromonospora sp. WMMD882]
MGGPDEITAARRALGRHLAHLRRAAGHTQHGLARLVQYGRSSVANTETGRQHPERSFWSRCDTVLRTGGVLAAEHDRIAGLDDRRRRRPAARADDHAALWEHRTHIDAHRSALTDTADADARLARLEDEVRQAVADRGRCPPATLVARLRPLRICVDQLMATRQHPPQRVRLYTAAARLAALLAVLAVDLRAVPVARAYAAEALDLTRAAYRTEPQARAVHRTEPQARAAYRAEPQAGDGPPGRPGRGPDMPSPSARDRRRVDR